MRAHQGIDYAAPVGTAVKATGDGRVSFVGVDHDYGKTIVIEHGGTTSTLYAHLSAFARNLRVDQSVMQGEIVGYVGNSGAATAPHLHYEYRVSGVHTDPRALELSPTAPIPASYLADFRSKSAALLSGLEGPGEAVVTALRN
jgi:murein DD-endopeptidase MepM/ murein hydrolase activator NlpD